MTTSAQLIERFPGFVDLAIRNQASVASYTIGGDVTLDGAYGGVTAMVTVPKGSTYRSRTLRIHKINQVEESNRGLTRVQYDPNDYASATLPGDGVIGFIRIIENDYSGTPLPAGPILVVPPSGYLKAGKSTLLLQGTAPNVASPGNGLPSQNSMWIEYPRFLEELKIYNDGGSSIFISPGIGFPEMEVPSGDIVQLHTWGTNEILIRAQGGTSAFRLQAVLVNGIQA